MTIKSENTPTLVIFFNDWEVFPQGINAGGGESATLCLAKALAALGRRVIACANLPGGECTFGGIEFWNFGPNYDIHLIEKRLREIGPYCAIAATLAHPFLLLREHQHCLVRVIINHSPSSTASGLDPSTVFNMIDRMICVSEAQRESVLTCSSRPEMMTVIRNGFDPQVFPYSGPEGRNWRKLIFIGRIEAAKGVHVLVDAFQELKRRFQDIELAIYGNISGWPDMMKLKPSLEKGLPGLKFMGKASQAELSLQLRRAGLLIFPSIAFESAGLVVLDAQASGCPVAAFDVGGVAEYLQDGVCGTLIREHTAAALAAATIKLLTDTDRLRQYSINCQSAVQHYTWRETTNAVLRLVDELTSNNARKSSEDPTYTLLLTNKALRHTVDFEGIVLEQLLDDHCAIGEGRAIAAQEISRLLAYKPHLPEVHLWQGLQYEIQGAKQDAIAAFKRSCSLSKPNDWQPFFRLVMLQSETGEYQSAAINAAEVLKRVPNFPMRGSLENIIASVTGQFAQ